MIISNGKSDVRHQSQIEIEKLRLELDKERIKYQEHASWLQIKRGDAIERIQEAYNATWPALDLAGQMAELTEELGWTRGCNEAVETSREAVDRFVSVFAAVSDALPAELALALGEAGQEFNGMLVSLQWLGAATEPGVTPEVSDEDRAAAMVKITDYHSQIENRIARVTIEFRKVFASGG